MRLFSSGFDARMTIQRGLWLASICLSVALFIIGASSAAKAVTVTVLGTDYEIGFFDDATLANTIEAELQSTPWYGSHVTAGNFATAFYAANGNSVDIGGGCCATLDFVWSYTNTPANDTVSTRSLTAGGGVGFGGIFDSDAFAGTRAFARVIVPVPEINGSALAKLTLVLGSIYLVLLARRQRRIGFTI